MTDQDNNPPDQDLTPSVAAMRAELLRDLTTVEGLAEALGRSKRLVQHYLAEGLPHVRIGKTPYIIVSQVRDWLEARSPAD